MKCLSCGDCCKRMSPLSAPEPCPRMRVHDGICLCLDYDNRPDDCRKHTFISEVCPIGLSVLNIAADDIDAIKMRLSDIQLEINWAL